MAEQGIDERLDQAFQDTLTNASAALTAVRGALSGAGSDAWDAFNAVHQRATALPQVGSVVAAAIQAVVDDTKATDDYRRQTVTELRDAGTRRLQREYRDLVHVDFPALEARLSEASLPTSSSVAAGDQMLRRQEVDALVAGVNGAGMPERMLSILGQNPAWDQVLCSDYGRVLLIKADQAAFWPQFRTTAAAKLLTSDVGSEKQRASRKALLALRDGEVRGRLDAFFLAGQRAIPPAFNERNPKRGIDLDAIHKGR